MLPASGQALLVIAIRTTIIYIVVLAGVRLSGKREVGQMTPFDLTLLLLISNSVQNAMTGSDNSLLGGIVAATTLLVLNYFVADLSGANRRFRQFVQGQPSLLIHDGQVIESHMAKEHVSMDELERALREHGSTERYYHDEIGYNYRMEGIQGAVLGVKLKHLQNWTDSRRRVAHRYQELLADTPLQLPREADYAKSAWHLFVVRHPRRDELKKHLEANQIGCALHYPLPLHLQKAYAHLGYKAGDFPVAEKAARECLSLPIYPELTDAQIQRVAEVIKDYFKKA